MAPPLPVARFIFSGNRENCESRSNDSYRRRKCIVPENSHKSIWEIVNPNPEEEEEGEWLVMFCVEDEDDNYSKDESWELGHCYLWNPDTCEKIELPSLLQWITTTNDSDLEKPAAYFLSRCVLSSPSGNLHDDSMIFLLFSFIRDDELLLSPDLDEQGKHSNHHLLLFCRPRQDKLWRIHKFEYLYIQSLYCSNHKSNELYLLCYDWQNIKIEFFDETLAISYSKYVQSVDTTSYRTQIQSVKSDDDDIFKVIRCYNRGLGHDRILDIDIYKMDLSLLVWTKVTSLNDHILFIGENDTTASCSASQLGLTKGYLYYTEARNLYKFDLEDNSVHLSLPYKDGVTPWVSSVSACMTSKTKDWLVKNEEDRNENADQGKTGGESEVVDTLNLNDDILKLVASYLNPIDYIHLRDVCKTNRLAIPALDWKVSSIDTTSLSPWLVLCNKESPVCTFVNPMHNNEKYLMDLSGFGLSGASIRYSKGGWLLMSKGESKLFFFNPFTKRKIKLPHIEFEIDSIMSFSSVPTSSDCVVFGIVTYMCFSFQIYTIRRGKKSWRRSCFHNSLLRPEGLQKKFETCLNNPVFFAEDVYCLDMEGILGVFRSKDASGWKLAKTLKRPCTSFTRCFLVECDGNLLSVFIGNLGEMIQIFRLDSFKKKWIKVESLGKHMLFISDTTSLSAIASDSRMENNVYLSRFHGEGILFYSLKTGVYHSVGSQHSLENFNNTKKPLNCGWIEPHLLLNTDEEDLDWLD